MNRNGTDPTYPPPEPDLTRASGELARFLDSYFTAKTRADVDAWFPHFDAAELFYTDAVLGWLLESRDRFEEFTRPLAARWNGGASYTTRAVGDMTSGMVLVVDTPELFGGPIFSLSPFDARDGRIVRWVDYWDARAFGAQAAAELRTPPDDFPDSFGEDRVGEHANPRMRAAVERLHEAFAVGDADAVAGLFAFHGVYEDMTLRAQIIGAPAVADYLARVVSDLPHGPGSSVRHVVGSATGGGYEWRNPTNSPARGATMLELDDDGLIARLTTVWDGAMMPDGTITALAAQAIPPTPQTESATATR